MDWKEEVDSILEIEGYEVDTAYSAEEALKKDLTVYNLLLLDVMMGEISGFKMARILRQDEKTANTPIIFLTAKDTENDMLTGFNLGADDYISKPFRPRELVSRIRSVLRRTGKRQSILSIGDIAVDTDKGIVSRSGKEIYLSALEYKLLLVFLNNRGQVLTRDKLLEEIWDSAGDYVGDNTLTVYIKRLREKIEQDPQNPIFIKTVRGLGYRLEG